MCLANDFSDHFFSVLGSHDNEVDNVFLEANMLSVKAPALYRQFAGMMFCHLLMR